MSEKTHIKQITIILGDQLYVYEIGQKINGLVIAKITVISDNVEKRNVIFAQDKDGRTVMQANHVTYIAEHC